MINIDLIIKRIQKKLVLKASEKGMWENFGQSEIHKLKDKYGYSYYGTEAEKKIAEDIDFLDNWCMSFDDNMLKRWEIMLGIKKGRI